MSVSIANESATSRYLVGLPHSQPTRDGCTGRVGCIRPRLATKSEPSESSPPPQVHVIHGAMRRCQASVAALCGAFNSYHFPMYLVVDHYLCHPSAAYIFHRFGAQIALFQIHTTQDLLCHTSCYLNGGSPPSFTILPPDVKFTCTYCRSRITCTPRKSDRSQTLPAQTPMSAACTHRR